MSLNERLAAVEHRRKELVAERDHWEALALAVQRPEVRPLRDELTRRLEANALRMQSLDPTSDSAELLRLQGETRLLRRILGLDKTLAVQIRSHEERIQRLQHQLERASGR